MTSTSESIDVVAVVVTHNRAEKLRECVASLLASQVPVSQVLIVDNASTDNTPKVVAEFPASRITYLRLSENVGGAGGFNQGVRRAYEMGAEQVWLMDDDARVAPESLGALLRGLRQTYEVAGFRPGFACSVVEWVDGSLCKQNAPVLTRDTPRWVTPENPVLLAKSCSFVSVLVPREGIEACGLPIADFFIWFDDTEYTQRLADIQPGIYCLDSRVVHNTESNSDIDFGSLTTGSRWKYELGLRNQVAWTRRNRGTLQVIELVLRRRVEMRVGRVPVRDRLAIYRAWARGLTFSYDVEAAPDLGPEALARLDGRAES